MYAHREDSEFHEPALEAVRSLAEGAAAWAIPWPCIHEFIAVVTHPKIYAPPTPLAKAIGQVDAWLESPFLRPIGEDPGYWSVARELLTTAKVSGAKVHDARVAALCRRWGVTELWTADRDFSCFRGVRAVNPLAG
ncbi:MAG: TA system VapC family ribonuclease toxin [Thermoanaerobaculia bacterium]